MKHLSSLVFFLSLAFASFALAESAEAPKSPGMETNTEPVMNDLGTNPHTGEGVGAIKKAKKTKSKKQVPPKADSDKTSKPEDASSSGN